MSVGVKDCVCYCVLGPHKAGRDGLMFLKWCRCITQGWTWITAPPPSGDTAVLVGAKVTLGLEVEWGTKTATAILEACHLQAEDRHPMASPNVYFLPLWRSCPGLPETGTGLGTATPEMTARD